MARILLIDHRPEHMRQPVLRLQVEGHDVDEASTAEDGMRMLREARYDLVLLDVELPGTDGWAVLKRIRQEPDLAEIKVIIFMAAKGETGKLGLYPVQGELRRPFAIGELLQKVREALSS